MMKKKKIIISDIDGTFLARGGSGTEKNIKAAKHFVCAGGLFTFASGRLNIDDLIPTWREFVTAPLLLCNGALVKNTAGEVLWEDPMDADLAREVHKACLTTGLDGTGSEIYTLDGSTFYKVTVWTKRDNLDRIERMLRGRFGERCSYTYSCETLLEMMPPHVSKASAIEKLRDYYKKTGYELTVYAVGDYINDLEMLVSADISACPDDAHDEVKKISDIILCPSGEGAVAELIRKITEEEI